MTERSSTFSSEPPARSARSFVVAAALAATLGGLGEGLARARGFVPAVRDDDAQWSHWRGRASVAAGPRPLALVGSSRVQTGVAAEVLARRFPGRLVVPLAINGSSPLPVLRDLAEDPSFRGDVLCELLPHTYFTDLREPAQVALDWLHKHRHKTWIADAESAVRHGLQARVALLLPELSFEQLAQALARRAAPVPAYSQPGPLRAMLADYTRADVPALQQKNASAFRSVGAALAEPQRRALYAELRRQVALVRARGGRVLFVRMPASRATLAAERERFARFYEEEFEAAVDAPLVSAEREPGLQGFDCPDDSHLDRRDREAFTEGLAAALAARGLR